MKFLILTQYFFPEPGAAQSRLAGFVRELSALGHEVEVVTAMPNYPSGRIDPAYRGRLYCRENWQGITLHRLWLYASIGSGLGRVCNYVSFAVTAIGGLLRASRPDYVFVESPPPLLAFSAMFAARMWGAKVILNVADLWPDTARDFGLMSDGLMFEVLSAFERWAYAGSDYVCAVTEGIRRALIEKKALSPDKVLFLPNGIDTVRYQPMPEDTSLKERLGLVGKHVLLYPGTLGYAHAADALLRAASLLRDVNAHFVFVGSGSAKQDLVSLAGSMKLTNVTFLDPVPADDVPRWLSIATCGLVSVRKADVLDGARPAKMFAIMACGKPVIYAGSGEGAHLLIDARAGIVTPLEDPEAVANAIRSVVEHPALAAEFGANGNRYARNNFGWDRLVRNWLLQFIPEAAEVSPQPQIARAS